MTSDCKLRPVPYLRYAPGWCSLHRHPGIRVDPTVGVRVIACRGIQLVLGAGGWVHLHVSVKGENMHKFVQSFPLGWSEMGQSRPKCDDGCDSLTVSYMTKLVSGTKMFKRHWMMIISSSLRG